MKFADNEIILENAPYVPAGQPFALHKRRKNHKSMTRKRTVGKLFPGNNVKNSRHRAATWLAGPIPLHFFAIIG